MYLDCRSVWIERLLAELGDLRKYDDPRKLVAAAGLNPQRHDSGQLRGARPSQNRLGTCVRFASCCILFTPCSSRASLMTRNLRLPGEAQDRLRK
ncbi:transposase [Pseudomonas sp. ADAK18]|uniref:transposase n=1 Tax=Pseudomonas sp. ADAK18 TaxID=2730848 RepID=UPI0015B4E18F